MHANATELSYRRNAVQEASPAGLVIILYDVLVEDLQRAIHAMQRGAIEERSAHLKHALLVLQLLEGSLDIEAGGATARSLFAFYSHIRSRILDGQFRNDAAILSRQVALLLDVREAWCTADSPSQANAGSRGPVATFASLDDSSPDEPSQWTA